MILFRNGFAPTLELVLFRGQLDTWLTHNCHPDDTRSPSNLRLGKPARKHHSQLSTKCFWELTPHLLSLSRLRKIVPEKHHLYSAVQALSHVGDMPSWHGTSCDPRPEPGQVGSRVVRFLEVIHSLEMWLQALCKTTPLRSSTGFNDALVLCAKSQD